LARSRIVVVDGRPYLVPRKKYKAARKGFTNAEETWTHILENIEDFGRPLEEGSEEAESEKGSEE